jgi:hypothetical protein
MMLFANLDEHTVLTWTSSRNLAEMSKKKYTQQGFTLGAHRCLTVLRVLSFWLQDLPWSQSRAAIS